MLFQRECPRVPTGRLPSPVPLPSLQAAFSRRAAIFGAAAASGALAGSAARALTPSATDDARLIALAEELDALLDRAAYALAPVHDEEDQTRRLNRGDEILVAMSRMPAGSPAGIRAKAKAFLDSDGYDVQEGHSLAESLANDIERVLGAAP